MSYFLDEETGRHPTGKEPALQVAPIHGVLPYDGYRNPMTRSTVSSRVSATFALPATNGVPKVFHFESKSEFAVALDALLDPSVFGLEVQLPPVRYWCRTSQKRRSHHFDMRLTFDDGLRRAVFVRNGDSLSKRKTQDEIEDIFNAIPEDFADEAIVVNGDHFTRAYRDNLRRIWEVSAVEDADADERLEEAARTTNYWLLQDLIKKSDLTSPRGFGAALRLLGRRILCADWHAVIGVHSRIELNA